MKREEEKKNLFVKEIGVKVQVTVSSFGMINNLVSSIWDQTDTTTAGKRITILLGVTKKLWFIDQVNV